MQNIEHGVGVEFSLDCKMIKGESADLECGVVLVLQYDKSKDSMSIEKRAEDGGWKKFWSFGDINKREMVFGDYSLTFEEDGSIKRDGAKVGSIVTPTEKVCRRECKRSCKKSYICEDSFCNNLKKVFADEMRKCKSKRDCWDELRRQLYATRSMDWESRLTDRLSPGFFKSQSNCANVGSAEERDACARARIKHNLRRILELSRISIPSDDLLSRYRVWVLKLIRQKEVFNNKFQKNEIMSGTLRKARKYMIKEIEQSLKISIKRAMGFWRKKKRRWDRKGESWYVVVNVMAQTPKGVKPGKYFRRIVGYSFPQDYEVRTGEEVRKGILDAMKDLPRANNFLKRLEKNTTKVAAKMLLEPDRLLKFYERMPGSTFEEQACPICKLLDCEDNRCRERVRHQWAEHIFENDVPLRVKVIFALGFCPKGSGCKRALRKELNKVKAASFRFESIREFLHQNLKRELYHLKEMREKCGSSRSCRRATDDMIRSKNSWLKLSVGSLKSLGITKFRITERVSFFLGPDRFESVPKINSQNEFRLIGQTFCRNATIPTRMCDEELSQRVQRLMDSDASYDQVKRELLEVQLPSVDPIVGEHSRPRALKRKMDSWDKYQRCLSSWSRTCVKETKEEAFTGADRFAVLLKHKDVERQIAELQMREKKCWIGCDTIKTDLYFALRAAVRNLEREVRQVMKLRSNCVTKKCIEMMDRFLFEDSTNSSDVIAATRSTQAQTAASFDGGLVEGLHKAESASLKLFDTPFSQELAPALALLGIILCGISILLSAAMLVALFVAKAYQTNVFSLIIIGLLICCGILSLTYYSIFFTGAGPFSTGNWKFLLIPDFIAFPVFCVIVMMFLYQYLMATRGATASTKAKVATAAAFVVVGLAVVGGAIAGIIETVRTMDILVEARMSYSAFALVLSLALLAYCIWIYVKGREEMTKKTQKMMAIMIGVVGVLVLAFAMQVTFEAMKILTQPIRAPVWASVVFSKMMPELLITFALLFVMGVGMLMGRNKKGKKATKRRKTKNSESFEEPLLVEDDEQSEESSQRESTTIPKAYDL